MMMAVPVLVDLTFQPPELVETVEYLVSVWKEECSAFVLGIFHFYLYS